MSFNLQLAIKNCYQVAGDIVQPHKCLPGKHEVPKTNKQKKAITSSDHVINSELGLQEPEKIGGHILPFVPQWFPCERNFFHIFWERSK